MNRVFKAGLLFLLVGCGAAENSRDAVNDGPRAPETTIPGANEEPVFKPLERSMIRRTKGVNRALYSQIQTSLKANNLPVTYQSIPTPVSENATPIDAIPTVRILTNCGESRDDTLTIDQRKANCQSVIGQRSATIWSAFAYGISGEGNWFLVTYIDKMKVWQDASTGLLWSDVIKNVDFMKALGRNPDNLEQTVASVCQSFDENRNAALGKLPSSQVRWRLPNREEFLQADINGARSVLMDSGSDLWTASYHKKIDQEHMAWAIDHKDGVLKSTPIGNLLDVRCVGVVTE